MYCMLTWILNHTLVNVIRTLLFAAFLSEWNKSQNTSNNNVIQYNNTDLVTVILICAGVILCKGVLSFLFQHIFYPSMLSLCSKLDKSTNLKPVTPKDKLNSYKVGEEITCFVSKVSWGNQLAVVVCVISSWQFLQNALFEESRTTSKDWNCSIDFQCVCSSLSSLIQRRSLWRSPVIYVLLGQLNCWLWSLIQR